jgi:hypothetical protein
MVALRLLDAVARAPAQGRYRGAGGPNRRCTDARTAENGFATSSGVSKSAKVVLVSPQLDIRDRSVERRSDISFERHPTEKDSLINLRADIDLVSFRLLYRGFDG